MAWYFGYKKESPPRTSSTLEVFFSKRKPTRPSHGHRYFAVTGPYRSAGHAITAAQEHRRHGNVDYIITLHPKVQR